MRDLLHKIQQEYLTFPKYNQAKQAIIDYFFY